MKTVKVKLSDDIMETLDIIDKLKNLRMQLDTGKWYEIEELGGRLGTKNHDLLLEIFLNLGAQVDEFSNAD